MVTQNDLVSASSSQVTTNHLSHPPLIMCLFLLTQIFGLLTDSAYSWMFMACLLSRFSLYVFFECPPFLPKLAIDSLFLYLLLKFKKKENLLGSSESHYSFCAMLFGLRYLIGHFSTHRLANLAGQGAGLTPASISSARGTNLFTVGQHTRKYQRFIS